MPIAARARIRNRRADRFRAPQNALEIDRCDVCEIATLAIPSTGIGGEKLQIG
jgi:hypothetical protein